MPDTTAWHLIQASVPSKRSSKAVNSSQLLCALNNVVPIGFPGSSQQRSLLFGDQHLFKSFFANIHHHKK
jgi:hypothetical protein